MTKRRAIIRVLITYLLVLLPLLVVTFSVTQTLLGSVEQKELDRIHTQLDHVSQALDEDFVTYSNKGIGLIQLKPFLDGKAIGDAISQLDAIDVLQKLKLFDDRVDEILVYYGEEYLCGNNGITSPNTYFQTTIQCTPKSLQDAISLLKSESSGVVALQTSVGRPYVMYHVTVGSDHKGRTRSVQYIFSISDIEELVNSTVDVDGILLQLSYNEETISLYKDQDGCKFVSHEDALRLQSELTEVPVDVPQGSQNGNVRFWYDDSQYMHGYHQIRNVTFLILIVGVLISTALSAGLGVQRIRNVRDLASSIIEKRVSVSKRKSWANNEFDYIQALINESVRDGDRVRENVSNYRQIILQQVSMMIFHGILRNYQEIQSLLSICGTELVEDYFYLCGIKLNRNEDVQVLETYIPEDLHYTDGQFVVVLCQLPAYDYDMKQRKSFADRLLSTLNSIDIHCDWILMSQVYNQISMANYAYLEISSIVEHMDNLNEEIVCWEDLIAQRNQHDFRFDNEHMQQFYVAIEQKNRRQAEKMLERIFFGNDKEESREHIRYMRYIVLQALRLGIRAEADGATSELQDRLDKIDLDNDDDFLGKVKQVLKEYCRVDGVYEKILEYVNENYMRYDLSLEQLAAEANVSKAQMSKVFRAKTGVGYIDYVTNLRMERAKELLAASDLGIKEIFGQVGYIDSTNASKKFKAIYGITPSAYRTQAQRKNGSHQEATE